MWFFYALAFAFLSSISVIIAKKVMLKTDHYSYILFSCIFTAPFLYILSTLFFEKPTIDSTFWLVTVLGTVISISAAIMAFKAIRESEVSLVNPISAFNPVFTTIISFFTLKEIVGLKSILGIVLVVLGAYFLQISKFNKGFLNPIKALITHKGVQLTFLAQLLWAITPSFEKTAILHTIPKNPSFAAFVGQLIAILLLIPLVFKLSDKPLLNLRINIKWFFLVGILSGLSITCAFMAYSLSPLGVSTAIFKLSLIIIPVLSWLFFKEKDIKERLLGSFIMLCGVILLII